MGRHVYEMPRKGKSIDQKVYLGLPGAREGNRSMVSGTGIFSE